MLKVVIAQLLLVASGAVGGLCIALLGLTELPDVFALKLVSIAILVWGTTGAWIWWSKDHDLPSRVTF
jgi:hypothetical protein